MWAQCVAIVALLVAAANGNPPVSNFGLGISFISLLGSDRGTGRLLAPSVVALTSNDWKVFGYLVGRLLYGSRSLPPAGQCTDISRSFSGKDKSLRGPIRLGLQGLKSANPRFKPETRPSENVPFAAKGTFPDGRVSGYCAPIELRPSRPCEFPGRCGDNGGGGPLLDV